jgi:hypothetical protein
MNVCAVNFKEDWRKCMSNLKILKIINPIMVLAFLVAAAAIVIKSMHLNPATFDPGVVYNVHVIAGRIFILLAIIHIILNWNWIKLHMLGIKVKAKPKKK